MQQILNAGLAYYVSNNSWPTLGQLQPSYLPSTLTSPWNSAYTVFNNGSNFYVQVQIPAMGSSASVAQIIVGTLPLAFTSKTDQSATGTPPTYSVCTNGAVCYAIGSVNIPNQSISGASAINFAGFYHSGSCVPAPSCPDPAQYDPQIMVVPAAVNGFYNPPTVSGTCTPQDQSGCNMTYYPLNGYTAYATGATTSTSDTPVDYTKGNATTGPLQCGTTAPARDNCLQMSDGTQLGDGKYWRVCLSVTTSSGDVAPTGTLANPWGQLTGTVMVLTRCKPKAQSMGSDFTVWAPSS